MGVNTFTAATHIAPVAIATLLRHAKKKGIKLKDGDNTEEATDDVFFDEAFHIVKAFIELGTHNTVESLQAFTNTHVPAPPWAAVSPVQIPLTSCNKAADVLIDWFGPDDLKCVVGGERWWQIRGLDGVDSEWITEKKFLKHDNIASDEKLTEAEKDILRMEHLESVLLYVHGGAYFWGSINTHRYQIIRFARKMKGRAFAVNYRKAPQYPWPCPLQDALAAYFYLTDPPPGALHKAIPPSRIVIAGDSAGGGLCLTMLTVLRDMGLQQPAGAVLISPWVDMTHSFPSVTKNTATDIIPPHGFIHKPSTTWPVHPQPNEGRARVIPTQTNPPPQPGHADTLQPNEQRLKEQVEERVEAGSKRGEAASAGDLKESERAIGSQEEMLESDGVDAPNKNETDKADQAEDGKGNAEHDAHSSRNEHPSNDPSADLGLAEGGHDQTNGALPASDPTRDRHEDDVKADPSYDAAVDFWEPKPPKVLMDDPKAKPLELRSQIQLYATNEQLTHPLVSPVLQGSLGNLCPLYIIAGDGEVLRDEIIYMAHKAAHPKDYPARVGILREGRRQKENAEKFQIPTKVHLQVFDGMCHVLTVFTFIESAKYAYNSIAQFIRHVTTQSEDHLERNPFPELHIPPDELLDTDSEDEDQSGRPANRSAGDSGEKVLREKTGVSDPPTGALHFKENEQKAKEEVETGEAEQMPAGAERSNASGEDIPRVAMIRERVDVTGHVRPMEPREEIEALQIKPQLIGLIKEAPVRRWLIGQEIWDKKFKHAANKVIARRRQYERKAERLLQNARSQGTIHINETIPPNERRGISQSSLASAPAGEIENDRRWGPLDLADEKPAPSAIAGRRDTAEAVALLKKNIYHTAPKTHKMVPKLKMSDAVRAAFDPDDHPTKSPRQSVSEQQTYPSGMPIHGLSIWQSLVTYSPQILYAQKLQEGSQEGNGWKETCYIGHSCYEQQATT
ncbi:alpha/beta-hydrolase [Wolfiporia cocos MD-104 SS10]|uniref:Alpha/beta-hydrolase n=1 Tax=Wolfiporia cocos (strain MD-104) TaxID=742152 RepID=A0A2H3JXM4_WOLCO|nr:alpha/beta-hydrolase [Wolfiporia cocos MD-104 SS10]